MTRFAAWFYVILLLGIIPNSLGQVGLPVVIELPTTVEPIVNEVGQTLEGVQATPLRYIELSKATKLYQKLQSGQVDQQLIAIVADLPSLIDEDGRSVVDVEVDDLSDELKSTLRLALCRVSSGSGLLQFNFKAKADEGVVVRDHAVKVSCPKGSRYRLKLLVDGEPGLLVPVRLIDSQQHFDTIVVFSWPGAGAGGGSQTVTADGLPTVHTLRATLNTDNKWGELRSLADIKLVLSSSESR